ncbi:Detected protein of confused Function [Hibiscus syriacus]|uniref:Detected protein of confused Function n=1 Tax=Hibiscus syriacus TaxID=106335 RepID=A0A6A2ZBE6_HIBSY|nr:Detected protein of confused Function [Hibiscus syriacus]
MPPDIEQFNGNQNNGNTNSGPTTSTSTSNTATSTTAAADNNNLSIIFDSPDDISASIDFSESPSFSVPPFLTNQDQFDISLVQTQIRLPDVSPEELSWYTTDTVGPLLGPPLSSVFDEDCLSSVPSYVPLNPSSPSCSFLGHPMASFMPAGSSGIFAERILLNSELQQHDLEFQGDNGGIFCPDSVQRVLKPGVLQGLSTDNQQLVGVATRISTPLASDITSLEDSPFNKVGKLSVEQRKEKIHRYMKKRNERNFSKKIKYACRKTLADSRPRVRGRFAKNDEFGETRRQACSNHEEEYDDEVVVKEEEEMVDSSDIFAHISGVNSFKCNSQSNPGFKVLNYN